MCRAVLSIATRIYLALESRYPYSSARGYTPPDASLETFLNLHKTLGGIDRAVLTQPSVYGIDNSCMMDALDKMGDRFRAVVAVGDEVTDRARRFS